MVRVIKPTREEREKLWKIPYIFDETMATPQTLEKYSFRWGIHSRYLEIMLWQLDTLYLLSNSEHLVWKGGTCVQSYLKPPYQRYSVDIDMNTDLDREGVIRLIHNINGTLKRDNKFVRLNGIEIGLLHMHSENKVLGVLNYFRLVPSKHWGEYPYKGEVKILGVIPIRIQINYGYFKTFGMVAINTVNRRPRLAPSEIIELNFEIQHSSREDLLADKLIAMVNVEEKHRGRLRIKDAYDILALLKSENGLNFELIKRKINLIAEEWGVEYKVVVKKSLESLEAMKEYTLEVLGLKGSVGHAGYTEIILQWKESIDKALRLLREKLC